MKASVNGGPQFDISTLGLDVVVTLEGNETLPPTTVTVTGGTLTVNRSAVKTVGSIAFHMFGEEAK